MQRRVLLPISVLFALGGCVSLLGIEEPAGHLLDASVDAQGDVGAADAGPWTPAALGDRLAFWFDPTSLVQAAGVVTRWRDLSGNGNDAVQADRPFAPAYNQIAGIGGLPSATFAGDISLLTIADSPTMQWGTSDFVVVAVARAPQQPTWQSLIYQKTATYPQLGVNLWVESPYAPDGLYSVAAGTVAPEDGTVFNGLPLQALCGSSAHVIGVHRARQNAGAGTLEIRVDGLVSGSITNSVVAGADVSASGLQATIGQNGAAGDAGVSYEQFNGDISELVGVNGSVTPMELAELEHYLMSRYGIADGACSACPAILAQAVSAPVSPPNEWLGLDLSNGGTADGGFGGGGLTIDTILPCAVTVEPPVRGVGAWPFLPGSRTAQFFTVDSTGFPNFGYLSFNLESRVISGATLVTSTGTLAFHARAGGPYDEGGADGGPSAYAISFDGLQWVDVTGVTKNGQDLPADWSTTTDDAGVTHASAWANEIYDGLMATYAPSVPAVADCLSARVVAPYVPGGLTRSATMGPIGIAAPTTHGSIFRGDGTGPATVPEGAPQPACHFSGGVLGVVPLGTWIFFMAPSNQALAISGLWPGGAPSCATPQAALDQTEYLGIFAQGNSDPAIGRLWMGTQMGTLTPADPNANPAGMLASEANTIAGCTGTTVSAPDPGYAAEAWGSGQVVLEYNVDSGVAYKLFAEQGYPGFASLPTIGADGGMTWSVYFIGVGTFYRDDTPVTLDWANADAGTLNATITEISNAWNATYCPQPVYVPDCVQAGNCVIVPDDGQGHSTFTLVTSPSLVSSCGDVHPLTFVFPRGTSVPSEIVATNPGGQ